MELRFCFDGNFRLCLVEVTWVELLDLELRIHHLVCKDCSCSK